MTSPLSNDSNEMETKSLHCAVFFKDMQKVMNSAPTLNRQGKPEQEDTYTFSFETCENGRWKWSRAAARKIRNYFTNKGKTFALSSDATFNMYFAMRRLKYSETDVRLDGADCWRLHYSHEKTMGNVVTELSDDKVFVKFENENWEIQNPTWTEPKKDGDPSDSSDEDLPEDQNPFSYQQKMVLWKKIEGTMRPTNSTTLNAQHHEAPDDTASLQTPAEIDSILYAFNNDVLTDL